MELIILSNTKRRYKYGNEYIFKPYNKQPRINYINKLIKIYEKSSN